MRRHHLVCILLVIATLAVFLRVLGHEFTNYDDNDYVYENDKVQAGLTLRAIAWAFTSSDASNWHPLTWISHIIDWSLHGRNPLGHHLTSLLLHIANVLLLFWVLHRMTGSVWRSGFAAALFAVHPLHVESVAWIAERKDVLSTLFWMLTMLAYVRYVEFKVQGSRFKVGAYVLVVVFFALGLMSKPMLVTLPFVLLLLDYWPLCRLTRYSLLVNPSSTSKSKSKSLVVEKIPLFILAAASATVTYIVQKSFGSVGTFDRYPLLVRIENALVSYVGYIAKTLWPRGLAAFYPHPEHALPIWQVVGAVVVLLGISFGVMRARRSRPYLAVGWLWYLGTLVPVIGLVQVGWQAMADRYTYIPLVGLFIMLSWGIPGIVNGRMGERESGRAGGPHSPISHQPSAISHLPFPHSPVLPVTAGIALFALAFCSYIQVGYWKNSVTLFTHALAVTSRNKIAHQNLGDGLAVKGRTDEAMAHFFRVLALDPENADAHYNIGNALVQKGNLKEAGLHFSAAIQIDPSYANAHCNLANVLATQRRFDEAIEHYRIALRLKPDDAGIRRNIETALMQREQGDTKEQYYRKLIARNAADADAHFKLANLLSSRGSLDEAVYHYEQALRAKPDYAPAELNLGVALEQQGLLREAMARYTRALRIKPDYAKAHLNLGNALSAQGKTEEAIAHYTEALKINPSYAKVHYNLANALVALGKLDEAVGHYREAIRLNPTQFEAHYNLANLLSDRGKLGEAVELLRKAIRLKPEFAEAHNNLAVALYKQGDYAGAWREVHLCVRYGGKPHPDFLRALSEKMPDPS